MAGTDTSDVAPDGTTTDVDVDVVVIGAGPVGENVAGRVRRHGLSAVIVESWLAGGECSYYAYIPSCSVLSCSVLWGVVGDRRGQSGAWAGSSKNSTGTGGGSRCSRWACW